METKIDEMVQLLMNLSEESADWVFVTELKDLRVTKLKSAENCFKVVATLGSSAEAAFDILSDISKRSEWDEMCEEGKLIEQVNGSTKIQYIKTKGLFA